MIFLELDVEFLVIRSDLGREKSSSVELGAKEWKHFDVGLSFKCADLTAALQRVSYALKRRTLD